MNTLLELKNQLFIISGIGFVILVLLPPIMPEFIVVLLTQSLLLAIVAMSLDVLMGYTGLGVLGFGAFFGVGAYVTAIFATRFDTGLGVNLLLSVLIAAAFMAVCAILFLRAAGLYFLLITLAVSMSLWGAGHAMGSRYWRRERDRQYFAPPPEYPAGEPGG